MVHSRSSSLADDYYTYTQSQRSSLYSEPPHAPSTTSSSSSSQQQQPTRKQATLAQISVPSFSAFRSQVSSIPAPVVAQRKVVLQSPRAASFSQTEKASPRFADAASRPLSFDSPLPQQPSGLANVLSPPLTEISAERQEERYASGSSGQSGRNADCAQGHRMFYLVQHTFATNL